MRYIIAFTLSMCVTLSALADNRTQQILKEVQKNLESIKNASYNSSTTAWEPYQTEEDVIDWHNTTLELDYPDDPYAKCQYIETNNDNGEIIMCYDGKRRMRTDIEKKTFEIDSLFKGNTEFRVVGIPFYHYCRRIVDFALNPTDSISLTLKETENTYDIDLMIYCDLQVEFSFAKPDPHLPEDTRNYIEDPTSHYIVTIDKQSMLPIGSYRLLCHSCSHEWLTSEPVFNQELKGDFNCFDYIPEGYISLDEYEKQAEAKKKSNPTELIGKTAPEWQLTDENGHTFSMSDLKGKKLILMFTGIGCGPCKKAIPYLNELTEKYDKYTLQVIAFESWGRRAKDIKGYKEHNNIRYDMLVDGESLMPLFNLEGSVPVFFIVDTDGIITHHFFGWGDNSGEEINKALGI